MKFAAKTSVDFEIVPAGNHVAILNGIVDLGIQPGRGIYPTPRHEVYLRFELSNERIKYEKDGKPIEGPMSIGRTFTASMSEKANLRKFIEGWFGKQFPTDGAAEAFEFKQLLSRQCLLNVTHNERGGKTYANINSAAPIPRGMQVTAKQENPSLYFDLHEPDQKVFDSLPKWLKEKIQSRMPESEPTAAAKSVEERAAQIEKEQAHALDDDIPFN